MTNIPDIPKVVCSSCVLHNFIIMENGIDSEDIDMSDDEDEVICTHYGPLQKKRQRFY